MIKWILFDQGQVQTYHVFSIKESYSINGKSFESDTLDAVFYTERYYDFMIGKISEDTFIKSFLHTKNLDLSIQEFKELFKMGIKAVDGMKELLNELNRSFNIATLINESFEWAQYPLDVSDFRKFFKEVITSGDLGISKPDKEFYLKALEIIKATPEECLFIDDREENCTSAQNLGIDSIVFRNSEQLRKELSVRKIL